MPAEPIAVFISYSHADAPLVKPLVKLLRLNESLVFQDVDDIRPGKRWRDEIASALARARLVVVFWCSHSSESEEVASEWKAAIEQEKDLLPLLLDGTPLPPELGEFQWIDFRALAGPRHKPLRSGTGAWPAMPEAAGPGPAPSAPAPVPPAAPRSRTWWAPAAAVAAVALMAAALTMTVFESPEMAETSYPSEAAEQEGEVPSTTNGAPEAGQDEAWSSQEILIPVLLLLLLFLGLAVRKFVASRRFAKREEAFEFKQAPAGVERRMASEVEAEILRRVGRRDAEA